MCQTSFLYIPLSYCPIVIELTLVDDATEPLVNQSGEFTVANTSFLWDIEQPIITCDIHRLDDGLFAEYAEIWKSNLYHNLQQRFGSNSNNKQKHRHLHDNG